MRRQTTRLALNRETIRALNAQQLGNPAAGAKPSLADPLTCITCVFGTCTCRDCDTSDLVC